MDPDWDRLESNSLGSSTSSELSSVLLTNDNSVTNWVVSDLAPSVCEGVLSACEKA